MRSWSFPQYSASYSTPPDVRVCGCSGQPASRVCVGKTFEVGVWYPAVLRRFARLSRRRVQLAREERPVQARGRRIDMRSGDDSIQPETYSSAATRAPAWITMASTVTSVTFPRKRLPSAHAAMRSVQTTAVTCSWPDLQQPWRLAWAPTPRRWPWGRRSGRRDRVTQARIRGRGHADGDGSHAGHHPSVVASGWGSPVSAARAAATSARLART
jgi:hypothetical protein